MKIINHITYKEILPDDGKVLTDGDGNVTAVSTPLDADISKWYEIDQPEEEPINE